MFIGRGGAGHRLNLKRAWERIRIKAKITDVRIHDLRRTVGSWLASSGESLVLIGKVLNHSNVSTTAIYARLNLDHVRQALELNAEKMLHTTGPHLPIAIARESTIKDARRVCDSLWAGYQAQQNK